ncbi:defender against death DAD protein [Trichodelitschia bisporula]|uniref:Dolichyl-diphosphooligosaccharide--protein glycosyltransferase subunit OST2 n=1 Tax=Trichodelitschia bisporula TaxID=703511 RepID=A0A6G1I747_9PEZI|nr:defender against death DAD protein [Trichodelitschia bisporula]
MAPRTRSSVTPSKSAGTVPTTSTEPSTSALQSTNLKHASSAADIVNGAWSNYLAHTPQRVKLLDAFLAFLVGVGALQFVYCVIVGNYPFNAFLSGFSATVGQFVLTASLRMQTNLQNVEEFKTISNERAFADFVFGSLLLHFFCVNFIN